MYLEIDEGFQGHRKTLRFAALLRDQLAPWYLVRLWTWACRSAPDGDLTGMEPQAIELVAGYLEMDGRVHAALIGAGILIDGRLFHEGLRIPVPRPRGIDYGPLWPAARAYALNRDDNRCQSCGAPPPLDVHHKRPVRLFDDVDQAHAAENLISLCRPCHARADADFRASEEG